MLMNEGTWFSHGVNAISSFTDECVPLLLCRKEGGKSCLWIQVNLGAALGSRLGAAQQKFYRNIFH